MAHGLFISFEGGEGAGKTTQIQRLKKRLEAAGKTVVTTREPGGTEGAEAIRALLVEGETHKWDNITETLLHFAARRAHVLEVIEPALAKGSVVVTDRFFDSTYAYQGSGQGLDAGVIDRIRDVAIGSMKPDITFLLDLPVSVGLQRATTRQRYEDMGAEFHERLREGFLDMAKKEPARFCVIDASLTIDQVEQAVWASIAKRVLS